MGCGSAILFPCLDLLVLEARHWEQVLEQKVEEDQRVKLQVAVVALLE